MVISYVFAGLFAASWAYARVLRRFEHRYNPNGTIFTVMGGCALIWLAETILYCMGVTLTPLLLFLTDIVSCLPIAAWQWDRYQQRKAEERKAEKRRKTGVTV